MTRPFDSYPTGTEAYDRLGNRLELRLEPVPKQISGKEQITIRFRFFFDGQPLQAL